ncbi:hypothetical protein C8R47DRAFT_1083011 [Mycena vitilis]|nr:hypothetical protein C8R47DRAFT_1083011 [Mycena vitilis]
MGMYRSSIPLRISLGTGAMSGWEGCDAWMGRDAGQRRASDGGLGCSTGDRCAIQVGGETTRRGEQEKGEVGELFDWELQVATVRGLQTTRHRVGEESSERRCRLEANSRLNADKLKSGCQCFFRGTRFEFDGESSAMAKSVSAGTRAPEQRSSDRTIVIGPRVLGTQKREEPLLESFGKAKDDKLKDGPGPMPITTTPTRTVCDKASARE